MVKMDNKNVEELIEAKNVEEMKVAEIKRTLGDAHNVQWLNL